MVLKCILVASSPVPPSGPLTTRAASSPHHYYCHTPPFYLHKQSGGCPLKCTTEEEAGVYLAEVGGTGYFMLGTLLPLASNPEAATFCRGGNYFVLRITQWKIQLYLHTGFLTETPVTPGKLTGGKRNGTARKRQAKFSVPSGSRTLSNREGGLISFPGPQNVVITRMYPVTLLRIPKETRFVFSVFVL